jgi:hypothetical protein
MFVIRGSEILLSTSSLAEDSKDETKSRFLKVGSPFNQPKEVGTRDSRRHVFAR